MKRPKKHIGEVIKTRRVHLRLTADEVALGCNVSRSRVYQWEKQSRVLPKNLPALSAALRIPVGRLQALNEAG